MDEKALLRRFNLRCLLVAGMLLGGMPFITAPLVLAGMSAGYPNLAGAVFNGLTVLPAAALAFWHRRAACFWLTVNAGVLVVCWAWAMHKGRPFDLVGVLETCGSIALAVCLDWMELRGWPTALGS
jgi:hypothetical protein